MLNTKGAIPFNQIENHALDLPQLAGRPVYSGTGHIKVDFEDGDTRPEVMQGIFLPLNTEDVTVEKVLRWMKDHKLVEVSKNFTLTKGVPSPFPSDSAPFPEDDSMKISK